MVSAHSASCRMPLRPAIKTRGGRGKDRRIRRSVCVWLLSKMVTPRLTHTCMHACARACMPCANGASSRSRAPIGVTRCRSRAQNKPQRGRRARIHARLRCRHGPHVRVALHVAGDGHRAERCAPLRQAAGTMSESAQRRSKPGDSYGNVRRGDGGW